MSQALRAVSNQFTFREVADERQNEGVSGLEEIQREPISDRERLQRVAQKINDSQSRYGSITLDDVEINNIHLSSVITLGDLRATEGNSLQGKLIDSLQLKKNIDILDQYFPFFERLKKVSYAVLDHVPLFSLQLVQVLEDPTKSVIVDALIEEEKFIAIPVQELEGRQNLQAFTLRMNHLYITRPDLVARLAQTPFKKPHFWETLQLPAAKLPLMPAKDVLEIENKLPVNAFGLLADTQVKELDFSKLSAKQIIQCIRGGTDDEKAIQRRFSILSPQQLSIVFKVVEDDVLHQFPIACFGKLPPVAEMKKPQLKSLFYDVRIPKGEQRQRVAMLSSDAINSILPKLDCDFLHLLADHQIRDLDYSKVRKEQLKDIFFSWNLDEKEKKARISILPVPSINRIIHHGFFEVLKYISDEQLSQIDLRNIPPEHLNALFPTLDPAKWHPGYTYSIKPDSKGGNRHCWEQVTSTGSSYTSSNDRDVVESIEQRKVQCQKNFQILSQHGQFAAIRGKISPEILELLNQ